MADNIDDPVPGFPKASISQLQSDLNSEFRSLESGYFTAKAARKDLYNEYAFKPYGNEQKGKSQLVDSSIFNIVEWMLPSLLRPLVEGDDTMKIKAEDPESLVAAEVIRELLTFQLKKKMNWYQFHYDTLKTAMMNRQSYAKITWLNKNKDEGELHSRPVADTINPDAIRYDWMAKDFYDSHVVTEEDDWTKSQILKIMKPGGEYAEGVLGDALDRAIEGDGNPRKTDRLRDEELERRSWVGDEAIQPTSSMGLFLRREHWTEYDMNGDGENIAIMAVFINDHLVQVIENPYPDKRPPYTYAQCIRDPYGANAWSLGDMLSDIQKLKTAIYRALSDNLASQNNGMYEVDANNVDAFVMEILQQGLPNTALPVQKMDSIKPIAQNPIAQHVFKVLELAEVAGENRAGFTRFSQGLDSKSLNKTATGFVGIMQKSQMRIWEMAQRYVETFVVPFIRKAIALNQQELDDTDLQLMFGPDAKKWIRINKDDIGGFVTVDVDVDLQGEKEEQINNKIQYMQYAAPFVQDGTLPKELITAVAVDLAKDMGLDNVTMLLREKYVGRLGITIPPELFIDDGLGKGTAFASLSGEQGGDGEGAEASGGEPGLSDGGGGELPEGDLGALPEGIDALIAGAGPGGIGGGEDTLA